MRNFAEFKKNHNIVGKYGKFGALSKILKYNFSFSKISDFLGDISQNFKDLPKVLPNFEIVYS